MEEGKQNSEQIEDGANISMQQQPQHTPVMAERPNTCQQSVDSAYLRNLRQGHPLMQTSAARNSASLMAAKYEQESLNVLQHSGQPPLQGILETKGGLVPEYAHPELQYPAFHQSQNPTLVDQLGPGNLTQAMPVGSLQASSETTSQADQTNSIDWVDSEYQKLLKIKETYLPQFIRALNNVQELERRASDVGRSNKWEDNRVSLEKMIGLLNISKSDFSRWKVGADQVKIVMAYLSQNWHGNPPHQKQIHQVDASGNHIEATHVHQQRENHLQFNGAAARLHQHARPGGAFGLPQSSLNSNSIVSPAGLHKADAPSSVNSYQYNLMRPTQQQAPHGNMAPSPQKGVSQIGSNPRAPRMLLHPSGGVAQYYTLGGLQQTVASQAPVLMPPLQNNQQGQAMMRQQLMADINKQQMRQTRAEGANLRHLGTSQLRSPVQPPSSSPYVLSPQNPQQSSSQLDPNVATPSLSSASPSALPSPPAPFTTRTPSTVRADSVKSPLLEESSKLANTLAAASQPPLQDIICNNLATDTQISNKSCLHKKSTSSGELLSSQAKGDPLDRLVEKVKSISSTALNATNVISRDLADDIISSGYQGTSNLERSSGMMPRMKRGLVDVALDGDANDLKFGGRGSTKRLKIETRNLLLQEISEINEKFGEIAADVMTLEDGTLVVMCSYTPFVYASTLLSPYLLLELIISADYPNASPSVPDKPPSRHSDGGREKVWMKARSNFAQALRKFSKPISVKNMAEAWGDSACQVYQELASTSSKYGKWENRGVAI